MVQKYLCEEKMKKNNTHLLCLMESTKMCFWCKNLGKWMWAELFQFGVFHSFAALTCSWCRCEFIRYRNIWMWSVGCLSGTFVPGQTDADGRNILFSFSAVFWEQSVLSGGFPVSLCWPGDSFRRVQLSSSEARRQIQTRTLQVSWTPPGWSGFRSGPGGPGAPRSTGQNQQKSEKANEGVLAKKYFKMCFKLRSGFRCLFFPTSLSALPHVAEEELQGPPGDPAPHFQNHWFGAQNNIIILIIFNL